MQMVVDVSFYSALSISVRNIFLLFSGRSIFYYTLFNIQREVRRIMRRLCAIDLLLFARKSECSNESFFLLFYCQAFYMRRRLCRLTFHKLIASQNKVEKSSRRIESS